MDQQTKFKTALAALAASAETKDRKLTKADVKEFLEDMDLGEEQMKLDVCLSGFQAYSCGGSRTSSGGGYTLFSGRAGIFETV